MSAQLQALAQQPILDTAHLDTNSLLWVLRNSAAHTAKVYVSANTTTAFTSQEGNPHRILQATRNIVLSHDPVDDEIFDSNYLPMLDFLNSVTMRPHHLAIHVPHRNGEHSPVDQLVKVITLSVDHDVLKRLEIREYPDEELDVYLDEDGALTRSTLNDLVCFRSLESLKVDTRRLAGFDDGSFPQLLVAWPQLTELQLNANAGWGTIRCAPKLTPKGLAVLLRNAPKLRSLAVAIDGERIADVTQPWPKSDHPLEALNLLDSVCPMDPIRQRMLAELLRGVAPRARLLEAYNGELTVLYEGPEQGAAWQQVFQLMG
ncbi:hypothetical protein CONPUDRAFT_77938 [Coniophora puteana RWD-64-598 SS2]|uniref:RNI-like protein n=1 Tax=Coniophora puteana (strain RWD-64-598) TaxID=741705 RepID=R7SFL9_CONPW|nr:uncharacterized protein CONPUDRAFT_77938 [Coniophora puteana RWD-64-598 SS2]EIW74665.1 hypothetical protein CONPUDRAFT_77938 [Coniophora puteana RWD-64-598 SS2]